MLASAVVSFVLAVLEGGSDKTAFVDPAVVSPSWSVVFVAGR